MKYIARPSGGRTSRRAGGSLSSTPASMATAPGAPYAGCGVEQHRSQGRPTDNWATIMSTSASAPGPGYRPRFVQVIQEDLQQLRECWLWFVVLGVGLIVLGAAALIFSVATTLVTMLVVGWMLVIGAV